MITRTASARVGILGNPSDGYGGRTLALAVPQFCATVDLARLEDSSIRIEASDGDAPEWSGAQDLVDRIDRFGYGTGTQLLAATVRSFIDVAALVGASEPQGFELRYRSAIPRQVGLAGSSALVVATLRCLIELTGVEVPSAVLASIALRVETEQLGITAGLQDRVVQVFGGLVAMDFASMEVDPRFGVAHGAYESVDGSALPPLFLAFSEAAAEPSGAYHAKIRRRFDAGDPMVRDTMKALAALVTEGRAALRWNNTDRFIELIGQNAALRRRLGPVPAGQIALVDVAVAAGAAATFTGSGGAVVGAYRDEAHLADLRDRYGEHGIDCVAIGVT